MAGRYKLYSEYKDSSVEWLGDLPTHWEAKRLGQFFLERREKVSDKDYSALSVTMQGIVPQLDTAAKTNAGDNRKLVLKNDFVINSRSDRKGSSGVSPYDGSVSLISIVLEPRNIEPLYVHHLLRSYPFQEEFYRFGKGIVADLWSTNSSEMKNIQIPCIPLPEQKQIARFLDHETGKIDLLIEKQQALIALLKEKRQAVISHAVTKGLNPNAPMKDSGVEWLGDVPEHWFSLLTKEFRLEEWNSTRLKFESSLKGRLGWQGLKADEYLDEGPHVVSSAHFDHDQIYWHKCPRVSEGRYAQDANIQLADHDVLLMKDGAALGKLAFVDKLPGHACLNSHLLLLRPIEQAYDPRFLFHLLTSHVFQEYMALCGTGATFAGVSQHAIGDFPCSLPPLGEQKRIACVIDKKLGELDSLSKKAQEAIGLMQERRTALISAAVTGKIDVRDWEPAPDMKDEL
ncbi:MAG: restriction endonuclease subunit S [Opitutae bacterium]|nr:restriction endonuclease subunit S [Opitutae bacterium]